MKTRIDFVNHTRNLKWREDELEVRTGNHEIRRLDGNRPRGTRKDKPAEIVLCTREIGSSRS